MRWMRAGAVGLLAAVWLLASSHVLLHRIGVIHEIHHDHHHHDTFASLLGATSADTPTDRPMVAHGKAAHDQPVHEHAEGQPHDAADGRCQLTPSDGVPHPTPDLRLVTGLAARPSLVPVLRPATGETLRLLPTGAGPPGLAARWQFLLRTALPVRAPSPIA